MAISMQQPGQKRVPEPFPGSIWVSHFPGCSTWISIRKQTPRSRYISETQNTVHTLPTFMS